VSGEERKIFVRNKLTEYKVVVYATSPDVYEFQNFLSDLTWEAGHCARSLKGKSTIEVFDTAIHLGDLLVVLSADITDETLNACRCAVRNDKPFFAFIQDSDSTGRLDTLRHIAAHGTEGTFVNTMVNTRGLTTDYLIGLNQLARILDKKVTRIQAEADAYSLNPFVRKFAALSREWGVLNSRCEQNVAMKRLGAAFVLDLYFSRLMGAGVTRWFIESGSSTAFFAETLVANWSRHLSRCEIETNNILAFLEFACTDSVRFRLYPEGRPEGKYGATFGPLKSVPSPVKPLSMGHPIEGAARFETDKIKDHFAALYSSNGLIFSATSGIEMDEHSAFPARGKLSQHAV
jgi:hypothetical protein